MMYFQHANREISLSASTLWDFFCVWGFSEVPDLLLWGDTIQQHDERLRKLLERARENNIKLNKTKCKIRTTDIKYIGHVLTADGLKPDEEQNQSCGVDAATTRQAGVAKI